MPNRINGPHDISKYFDKVATGFHMKEYTTGELSSLCRGVGFSGVASYIGAKGYYFRMPQFLLRMFEAVLEALPYRLRSTIGRGLPVRLLLEIRMVCRK